LKKVYIGPIAPQSFLADDDTSDNEELDDSADDEITLQRSAHNVRSNTINMNRIPSTPPSISRNLAQRNRDNMHKAQSHYLRATDPIPDT
jgi:hypothetical protein